MMSISNDDVAKAISYITDRLGITQECLESILGVSDGIEERMLGLTQIARYLESVVGSDDIIRQWMTIHNSYFEARPMDVVQQPGGIECVIQYLEMILNGEG